MALDSPWRLLAPLTRLRVEPVIRRLATLPRAAAARAGEPLIEEERTLTSRAGYRLAARLVRRVDGATDPALVVSPAIDQGIAGLAALAWPVSAHELARAGYQVLLHDPAGRGGSWGEEDFGGPEHADDVRVAVAAARELGPWVGVLGLSLGLSAAAAAVAHPDVDVRFLLDWEGPCDREIITAGGARLAPAAGHALDDDAYWSPREAVRHLGAARCAYIRLQAVPDHAQPDEVRHAFRAVRAALGGSARFVQLNDHPRGVLPDRPAWLRPGMPAANAAILGKLRELRVER